MILYLICRPYYLFFYSLFGYFICLLFFVVFCLIICYVISVFTD